MGISNIGGIPSTSITHTDPPKGRGARGAYIRQRTTVAASQKARRGDGYSANRYPRTQASTVLSCALALNACDGQHNPQAGAFGEATKGYHTTSTVHETFSKSEARCREGHEACKAGATGAGEYHPQTPNHRKHFIVMDNQTMEPPNLMPPKVADTAPPTVPTKATVHANGGRGRRPLHLFFVFF